MKRERDTHTHREREGEREREREYTRMREIVTKRCKWWVSYWQNYVHCIFTFISLIKSLFVWLRFGKVVLLRYFPKINGSKKYVAKSL